MEYELKRINAWSVIKIVFLISFFIGALIGIFYAFIITIIGNLFQNFTGDELNYAFDSLSGILIFLIILFFAIFTSIVNSILSVIIVGIYNLIAQWIGGFKVSLNDINNKSQTF